MGVRYASNQVEWIQEWEIWQNLKNQTPSILKKIVISSAKLPSLLQSFPVEKIKFIGLKLIYRGEIKLILGWE